MRVIVYRVSPSFCFETFYCISINGQRDNNGRRLGPYRTYKCMHISTKNTLMKDYHQSMTFESKIFEKKEAKALL